MSGKDETSSVYTIDAIKDASQNSESRKVPRASFKKQKTKTVRISQSDGKKKLVDLRAAHRKEIQALKSKHRLEYKSVRSELREQLRKSNIAIKEAKEGSKKFYEGQLRQIRDDYTRQNESLRAELKKFLAQAVDDTSRNYETTLANESNERFDSLRSMIHEDFVLELQKKTDETEQIKAESEAEIARVTQESRDKGHRIAQLEIRMKAISHYLPDDIRKDIYEQFGFRAELDSVEEKPKRKGLLARLRSR